MKSGIMEVKFQQRTFKLKVGRDIAGIKIVNKYKYLGIELQRDTNIIPTFNALYKRMEKSYYALTPALYRFETYLRWNCWCLFVRLVLEMISIPFTFEIAKK